jgi:uncharacterized membrane protein YccC
MNQQISRPASEGRALLARLAQDFTPWPVFNARFIDETECLLSVLLAILWSHLLGIGNVGWAAFSAYMVMRASFAESLRRGGLRVLGTAAGASLAWLLAPALLGSTPLLSAALGVVGAVTLYLAVLDRRGYGWLFVGLSFAMVLVGGMENTNQSLAAFARSRLVEVCVGTGASILVSAVSTLTVRRRLPADSNATTPAAPPSAVVFGHRAAWLHALQGAIALALIPWVWSAFHFEALGQSAITIMVVMMVPVADLAASGLQASTRLRHRCFGGGAGAVLATGILVLSHGSPIVMTLAVCVGVLAGRHIENGKLGIDYAGTQFALAFLVVLVPDSYAGVSLAPGLERLSGILLGMTLLEPVRLLLRRLAASPCGRRGGQTDSADSGHGR